MPNKNEIEIKSNIDFTAKRIRDKLDSINGKMGLLKITIIY